MGSSAALRQQHLRRIATILVALVCTCALAWAGIVNGVTDISSARLAATLLPGGFFDARPLEWTEWVALVNLRLPRIGMAVVAGVGLALAGLGMQVITNNPMASPFTTGVSNAAAFGASLAMLGSLTLLGSSTLAVTALAFVTAALCSVVVVGLGALSRHGTLTLVLAGIALSYLFSALAAGLQYVADEQQLAAIVSWTFGDLGRGNLGQLGALAVFVVCAAGYMVCRIPQYQKLAAGEEVALALGVPVRRLRVETGFVVTAMAAAIISLTGVIGFVGLVAPHVAKLLVGADERYRLPLTATVGAGFLLAADLIGRLSFSPVIVPVGIVVSLVGVPLFLWLVVRQAGMSRR